MDYEVCVCVCVCVCVYVCVGRGCLRSVGEKGLRHWQPRTHMGIGEPPGSVGYEGRGTLAPKVFGIQGSGMGTQVSKYWE
jgi:hypothetical protein